MKQVWDDNEITNLSVRSDTKKYLYKKDNEYFHYDDSNKKEIITDLNYCNRELNFNDYGNINLQSDEIIQVIKFNKPCDAFLAE